MTREELIRELLDNGLPTRSTAVRMAEYILSRERLLLEKVGKPLKDYKQTWLDDGSGWEWGVKTYPALEAIDEALAIIEKEKGNV